jgi:Holliday junction resolvasome RuvABC endonuclease subunit
MRLLALDVSSKTGWSVWEDGTYVTSGALAQYHIPNFNVNDHPEKQAAYPFNVMDAAIAVTAAIGVLISEIAPDFLVIEHTTKGRNRSTQRWLEWLHFALVSSLRVRGMPFQYRDPSEWRKAVGMVLTKEQKKNNREVSQGKKRGRVTKKHLAVNMVNDRYHLKLLVKDNDQADAILLGLGHLNIMGTINVKGLV